MNLESLGSEYAMDMTPPTPLSIFMKLIQVMNKDNGCIFKFTPEHQADAVRYIKEMQDSGIIFPDPDSAEAESLDGLYWKIGAPMIHHQALESSEIPGFTGLNVTLGEIFNGEVEEVEEFHGIVKIQRPLNTLDCVVLIYNKGKDTLLQVEFSKEQINSLFNEGEFKIYMNVTIVNGVLNIISPAANQDW